jgi:UDP-2,3-diacylglucosamine pyrophosphatase LpxH
MLLHPPKYDELYVISDIHMGGTKNSEQDFQIFNRGTRLANLINLLASHHEDDEDPERCLVLNGDIIDSLAEDQISGYVALDQRVALNVLDRIFNDPSFSPVWKALAKFIKRPRRHLVFVVGNHDIELSLPCVEAYIRQHLAGKSTSAQSRLIFSTHGCGFACHVGHKRVFCTHGNEVDAWNSVDYNLLGQLGNAMNAGRIVESDKWLPNAGTRLVVDVMNKIKKQYPFVDLLQPETKPVLSILLTLDNKALEDISFLDAFPVLRDKIKGGLQRDNLLSADADNVSTASHEDIATIAVDQLLGNHLKAAINTTQPTQDNSTEDDLLAETELAIRLGISASEVAEEEGVDGALGWWTIFAGKIGVIDKVDALRGSLKDWLEGDDTFDIDKKDETYERITERVNTDVDFIITGHTHLARAIEFDTGRFYFNSGTWIRLLRLTKEVLEDDNSEAFKNSAWKAFSSGRMSDLDITQIPGKNGDVPLLYDRTHTVCISEKNGLVTGQLIHVTGGENEGDTPILSPEFKTN